MYAIYVTALEGDTFTARDHVAEEYVDACIAQARADYPEARAVWAEDYRQTRAALWQDVAYQMAYEAGDDIDDGMADWEK